jgi:hypothetical protein
MRPLRSGCRSFYADGETGFRNDKKLQIPDIEQMQNLLAKLQIAQRAILGVGSHGQRN